MPTRVRNFISKIRNRGGQDRTDQASAENEYNSEESSLISKHDNQEPSQENVYGNEKGSAFFVKNDRMWDVKMPPYKQHVVGGRLIPTLRRFLREKRRRISIEVHAPSVEKELSELETADIWDTNQLGDRDTVFVQILRPSASTDSDGEEGDEDEISVATEGLESADWQPRAKFKIDDVTFSNRRGNVVEVRMGAGNEVVVRDIRFQGSDEALSFEKILNHLMRLVEDRAKRQLALYKEKEITSTEKTTDQVKNLNVLVEIVSAVSLPVADVFSTDAYVVVHMGGKEIHRTHHIQKTISPIWTFETGSLFLIQADMEKTIADLASGLTFTVKDYDTIGRSDVVGQVCVALDELLDGNGERVGYPLEHVSPPGNKNKNPGKLFLRYKIASKSDIEFMTTAKGHSDKVGVYLDETYVPIRAPKSKAFKVQKKKGTNGDLLVRVKPNPDPNRAEETKWMTEADVEAEALKESTNWVESGSGNLGKLYFEIIGCDGLHNSDKGSIDFRNKTDAFACIVFEKSIVNTDVINDSLSPRWMPWSCRAFAFNISHPSSDILVGLFDFDTEMRPSQIISSSTAPAHDRIGRARINLAQFLPNTVYNLTYDLTTGSIAKSDARESRGKLHLRLRTEFKRPRQVVLTGLTFPPMQSYLAVAKKNDFRNVKYTVDGHNERDTFSMSLLLSYFEELQSYHEIFDHLVDAVLTVVLWRGHYKLTVCTKTWMLPVHSLVAYMWGVLVTWNLNLFPSFVVFSVGWATLAFKEYVSRCPSRWQQTPGYFTLLRMLVFNNVQPETVRSSGENSVLQKYYEAKEAAAERVRLAKVREEKANIALESELREDIEAAKQEDIEIATAGTTLFQNVTSALNPLSILQPVQSVLRKTVESIRVGSTIVLWEESYIAFWIVTMSMLLSILLLVVPWGFVLRWGLRISVWVLLGPWMRLIDVYLVSPLKLEEERGSEAERRKEKHKQIIMSATKSRIRSERALKLKAMKRFYFGKFLLSVPGYNYDKHWDKPLESSTAQPYEGDSNIGFEAARKYGQDLTGDMVMAREVQLTDISSKNPPRRHRLVRRLFRRRGKQNLPVSESTPLISQED